MEPEQEQDLAMEPGQEGEPEELQKDSGLLFVEPP